LFFGILAVIKFVQGLSASGVASFVTKVVQIGKVQGDTAFERGEYTLCDKDNKLIDNGK